MAAFCWSRRKAGEDLKPSEVTVAAVEDLMLTEGVTPPTEEEEQAKAVDVYAPPPRTPPR